jgi:membrane glycosyltransferase
MAIHDLTGAETEAARCRPHAGLTRAVLDPYVNAIHVTLLREKKLNPVYAEQFERLGSGTEAVRLLGEKLLAEGPDKLKPAERMFVLADQRVMVWLHQQAWVRPEEKLAPWWKAMIREFSQREN